MEPSGNAEQLLPCLCIVDAQCDLRVRSRQRFAQLNASDARMCAPAEDGSFGTGGDRHFQCATSAAALDVLGAQPAFRAELCTRRGFYCKRKDKLQRFFVAFQLGKTVLCKGCGNSTHGKSPAVPIRNHLCRSIGHKAGPELCIQHPAEIR